MPRSKPEEIVPADPSEPRPYSIIINGEDRVILAKDDEDMQAQIAKLRAS